MKTIIKKALDNSFDYFQYRKVISELLLLGKVTGNEQSDSLLHYSNLNQTRMNRLDKTILISNENVDKLKLLSNEYIWLVLSEGWCGDAAQILPVLNKMSVITTKVELKIVFRDQNPDLMNLFLTNGTKSIPKLIIIDKHTLDVVAQWGPRPVGAIDLISNYKIKFGMVDETAKSKLQLWYLHDKGMSVQNEIISLMDN